MERVMGIEPTCSAWKADILPLNYTRTAFQQIILYHNLLQKSIVKYKKSRNAQKLYLQSVIFRRSSVAQLTKFIDNEMN